MRYICFPFSKTYRSVFRANCKFVRLRKEYYVLIVTLVNHRFTVPKRNCSMNLYVVAIAYITITVHGFISLNNFFLKKLTSG